MPRIKAGVTALTLAKEWNAKQILTATGKQWRASTVAAMYLAPRMCGRVKYRGAVLRNEDGSYVRGEWQPMMSDEDYDEIVRLWRPETATDKDATTTTIRATTANPPPPFDARPRDPGCAPKGAGTALSTCCRRLFGVGSVRRGSSVRPGAVPMGRWWRFIGARPVVRVAAVGCPGRPRTSTCS
nr:recombinase family protein [Fodinicola feengrottensis]